MRVIAALLFLVTITTSGVQAETIRLGDRFYVIDIPARPRGAPLILALHGGGGSPDQFARASGLAQAAVDEGYAVIFPAGSVRAGRKLLTWNAGYCCGFAARAGVDDDAFLIAVIKDASVRFGLDAGRVYLAGMSNGSMMVEAFAARNSALVQAVAGVAGTMDATQVVVEGRVPLLVIHGTADKNVPYEGGVGADSISGTDFASVPSVVQAFLASWSGPFTITRRVIDQHADGTSVIITDHLNNGRVVLRLMAVEGGAHHWPGGKKARQRSGATQEIDANTELLRFFALHP